MILLPSRRDLPKFDGSALFENRTLVLFSPRRKHCSRFPRCSRFLRCISLSTFALAPLSCINCSRFPLVQLAFEIIYNPLGLVCTVVKPACFVVVHLQDPSLQCSPLSHNRNAPVTGGGTSLHQLFPNSSTSSVIGFW